MSTPRHYTEAEIAAIFEAAASAQRVEQPEGGLTLEELREIALAAGLDPALVTKAARALDAPPPSGSPPAPHAVPGVALAPHPVPEEATGPPLPRPKRGRVAHTVALPGPLSDAAWDRLVTRFRDTFGVPGTPHRDGALRSWRNGTLQALVEPHGGGHRLRFQTAHEGIQTARTVGAAALAASLVLVIMSTLNQFQPDTDWMVAVALLGGLVALLTLGGGTLRGRRWAATRQAQFSQLGAEAQALAGAPEALAPVPAQRQALQPASDPLDRSAEAAEEPVPVPARRARA